MSLPETPSPRRGARIGIITGIGLVHLLIMLAALILFGSTPHGALAQDKPPETPEAGGVRFDTLPHPFSRGALAYTLGDRWDHTDLTYYFHNCPRNLDCDMAWDVVRDSFDAWANLSTLTFTEVDNPRDADIELEWSISSPELGWPGDVLAFATFPSDGGDVVFDDAEPWTAYDRGSFDLFLVATHEIGHALGIDHSSVPNALMYPVLTPQVRGLTEDDQGAIQALYGTPEQRRPEQEPQNVPVDETFEEVEVTGEITDRFPFEIWEFDALAGETLTITMTATSGDLVPYLGLLTGDEEVVLAEEISRDGETAQITYTFDDDDLYVIYATREGLEDGNTTGDYVLSITAGEPEAAPAPDGDDTILVDIRSYTNMDICEVYFSPTVDTEWGQNVLDDVLTNGNLLELYAAPDLYDVLIVGCDGTELEQYEIRVERDMAIEVYDSELNVYIYRD